MLGFTVQGFLPKIKLLLNILQCDMGCRTICAIKPWGKIVRWLQFSDIHFDPYVSICKRWCYICRAVVILKIQKTKTDALRWKLRQAVENAKLPKLKLTREESLIMKNVQSENSNIIFIDVKKRKRKKKCMPIWWWQLDQHETWFSPKNWKESSQIINKNIVQRKMKKNSYC